MLENDIKREYQQFLQERNRDRDDSDGRPDRGLDEIRAWAVDHDLPCDDLGHVQFPDLRIEYDIDGRDRTLDVEVMTPHYRGAHAAAKSGSGFRLHGSTCGGGGGRMPSVIELLPAWTLRIVEPPQFPDIAQRAKQAVWNQLMTTLRTEMLDELRWYFEHLRAHPAPSRSSNLDERFYRAREAFSTPRFKALHRVWKQDGEAALASAELHTIGDAAEAGVGRVETLELGHRYGHLSPLVAVA